LATNRITEKIFVFYWFWLGLLFIITLLSFIYYCTMFCSTSVRWRDRFLAIAINDTKDAKNQDDLSHQDKVHKHLGTMSATKFFFLYLVGQNVDYETLKALSHKIYELSNVENSPSLPMRQSMMELTTLQSFHSYAPSSPSRFEVEHVGSIQDEDELPVYSPYNSITEAGYHPSVRENSF